MSYASKLLSRGEEIIFETRQHWFALVARSWIWLLAALLASALLIYLASQPQPTGEPARTLDTVGTIVALVVLVAAVARVGLLVWAWQNQEFLVTTRRLIRAEGIFNKQMADSNLEKINDAVLSQSFIGRIFDYGTLDILTAAEEQGGINDFPMMADPVKFKIAMLNQKEVLERPELAPPRRDQQRSTQPAMEPVRAQPPRSGSPWLREVDDETAAPPDAPAATAASDGGVDSLAATLEALRTLRERGLITDEEFESKKRQLLERI